MDKNEIEEISRELENLLESPTLNQTRTEIEESVESIENIKTIQTVSRTEEVRHIKPVRYHNDWIRPADSLLAAFFVPVIIMIIIFIQREIFPFGEESFLRTDMYHQYAPFFSEFRDKLTHGGSLLYSWDIGMGVNFAALYAYYLASPLNWLLVFCPSDLVIEFMTYSIVLKIGLSGLSFAYYLRKHGSTQDFGVAFFGIFYALSGYMAAYSWNIMWLDCILLFPLIVLGLERLVKEKKCLLYCITLGVSILSNYYISIMTCIFMVLYFVALLILEKKKPVKEYFIHIGHFTLFSLIAGGLAAAVLIPEIFALQATASGDFNFPKTLESYFPIFDMIARHIGNVETEIGLDHWPNLYCGVAVLMFFLLYLVCRKISVREKVVYCTLLFVFFISFSINALNFIWHGFHYPNSLPCRQSFIYIFLMLLICYRAYMHLKSMPWKYIVLSFWGSVIFVILAEKLVTEEHFHFSVYYVAILFLAFYVGLLYLYKIKKVNKNLLILLTLGVVSIEAAVNTAVTSITTTSRTDYIKDNDAVEELVNLLQPADSFYRIEKVARKTKNDGAWMNFPSVSIFSSTANADLTQFFKYMGCESSTNAYSITGSTPLVDSLFSVRYGLYSSEQKENDRLTLLKQEEGTYLYENAHTLPLGFMVAPDFEDNWQYQLSNPADVQNDLSNILGVAPVLLETVGDISSETFQFTPEETGDYYVYVINKKVESVTATIGERTENFDHVNRGFFLELGICEQGEEVVLEAKEDQILDARVYRFSEEGMEAIYNTLNRNPLKLTNWTDTTLEGTVSADAYGMLFTSIPYDKGWSVMIDGEPKTPRKLFDTFLTVDVPAGTHTISLEYEPQGLKLGIVITGGSILFLIIYITVEQINKRRRRRASSLERTKARRSKL